MKNHLRTEEVTLLIEGLHQDLDLAEVKEHLDQCDRCRRLYRDAALERGLWNLDKGEFPISQELVELGNAVAERNESAEVEVPAWAGRSRTRRLPRLAVAASVVVAVSALLFLRGGPGGVPPLDATIVDPVRHAVEAASATGGMVIPGGEAFAVATADPMRSGNTSGDIDASLDALRDAVAKEDASVDAYCWLIAGLLASGDREEARVQMMGIPDAYRDDDRVRSLMAAVHFAGNNLDLAEDYLQALAVDVPEDPFVEFNLAVVLAAGGDTAAAAGHLESVASQHPGTPIASRAQQLLAGLQPE